MNNPISKKQSHINKNMKIYMAQLSGTCKYTVTTLEHCLPDAAIFKPFTICTINCMTH